MRKPYDEKVIILFARQLQRFNLESEECKKKYGHGIPNNSVIQPSDIQLAAQVAPNNTRKYPLAWAKNSVKLRNALKYFREGAPKLLQDRSNDDILAKPVNETHTMESDPCSLRFIRS